MLHSSATRPTSSSSSAAAAAAVVGSTNNHHPNHHHHSNSNHQQQQQMMMVEQPSWSSQSASPSPPLPPPMVAASARWARVEQQQQQQQQTPSSETTSCPHCRGRLASLPTRTTSISSYSGCKVDSRNTPILRPHDDEDSFPVLCDRELHSLHRNVPALRRRDVDTATIKQHYYPEGGWGWLVCGAAFLAHLLTSGLQLAFGLLYIYTIKFLVKRQQQQQDSSPAAATSTSLDGVTIHHDFYVMATVLISCCWWWFWRKMNELKGKFVNIVLSVEEGRGFDSVKNPMYVTANFNGRVMESDVVEAHPNVIFNTEMVWETEKKLLRRARGAYARVRIECFTTEKRFVGFVLLCLRSAHILASSRTCLEVPFTWNRLINVPSEFKRGTPELHVSLTIRDYLTTSAIADLPPAIPPQTCCPQDEVDEDKVKIDDKVRIPIRYGRNGFLQVGRDDEKLDRFQLKITSKMASNLDTLLPESVVFSQSPKKYHLSFDVFGTPVKTRTFARDLHENVNVNETVVVNLLSNVQVLSAYFQQFPTVEVTFLNDQASLGRTQVDFTRFDWEMKQHEPDWTRMEFEEDCEFDGEETEMRRRRTPTLGVKAQVERLREVGQGDKEVLSPKVRYSPSPQCGELLIETKTRPQSNSVDRVKPVTIDKESTTTNTETAILQSTSSPQLQPRTDDDSLDVFQQFCLDLIVENFTWRRPPPPKSTHCYFNFQHPKCNAILSVKADLERQINRRVQLEKVVCKLIFISTKTRVKRMLSTHSPRIHLVDSKRTRLSQDFGVDAKLISLQQPELTQFLSLKTLKGEELADVSVSVFLEVADLGASSPKSNYELLPTILDDSVIISDLAQLELWKQEERDRFKSEMEALRKRELQVLHKDWISRKNKLENDLRNNITRCKKLSRQLKKSAHRAMIDRAVESRRKSDGGGGGGDEDEDEFNLYMEIHKNAVKYSLCETHELIEKISRLERECVVLRDLLAEQELEMDEIRKDALTGEQTQTLLLDLKLLEEKYEEVQRDKNYFKSEWEKAVKEVHQLKVEDQKNLQSKIAIEKEQLSQLSLDTFITISGPDNK